MYAFMELPELDACTWDAVQQHQAGVSKQEVYSVAFGCAQALSSYALAHVAHL